MTLEKFVLKNGFYGSSWQILEINSAFPFTFEERFQNLKTFDLLKETELLKKNVVSYWREIDRCRYIIFLEAEK